jgi:hypothetical protein
MLHSESVCALRLVLLVFDTCVMLTDHRADKWTDLAVDCVAP